MDNKKGNVNYKAAKFVRLGDGPYVSSAKFLETPVLGIWPIKDSGGGGS